MKIINTTTHSTLWEEVFLSLLCVSIFIVLILILVMEIKKGGKFLKTIAWTTIIVMSGVIIHGVPNSIKRSYNYEMIEAQVYDWDFVMNNEEYELLEKDGNIVQLKRIIED